MLKQTRSGIDNGDVLINGAPLEAVDSFCYLGSMMPSADSEISQRIAKASSSFWRLKKRGAGMNMG